MKIDYYVKTDVGKVRKVNEDSYGIVEDKNLFFVCDGMGGTIAGNFASNLTSEIVTKSVDILNDKDIDTVLKPSNIESYVNRKFLTSIFLSNRAVYNFSQKYHKLSGMGTTISLLWYNSVHELIHICQVGDSRIYLIRNNKIRLLTKDHTKLAELLQTGKITYQDTISSEIKSMITRAVGVQPMLKIDYILEKVYPDDYIVLCTDGLCDEVNDETIRDVVINFKDVKKITEKLIDLANESGGKDNVTAIVLKFVNDGSFLEKQIFLPIEIKTYEDDKKMVINEEKVLPKVLNKVKIKLPEEAKEKTIFLKPLHLGITLAIFLVIFGVVFNKITKILPTNKVVSYEGKVLGIGLSVRVPDNEQLKNYYSKKDRIEKLMLIEAWYKNIEKNTVPVEGIRFEIRDKNNIYEVISNTGSVNVNISGSGLTEISLVDKNYVMLDDKSYQTIESIQTLVEPADSYLPVVVILVPSESSLKK